MLEERDASSGDVEVQTVWSPVYVDAMVLRDEDTDADGDTQDAGGGERLYVLHDANFNVTALTDVAGIVQERFLYDPYGERTVLNADWTVDTDGLSDFAFVHGHQGGRHDLAAGLVDFRNRQLDTSLGRWERQDPNPPPPSTRRLFHIALFIQFFFADETDVRRIAEQQRHSVAAPADGGLVRHRFC